MKKYFLNLFLYVLMIAFSHSLHANGFSCAKIVLQNGEVIEVENVKLALSDCSLSYKTCGKPQNPEVILSLNSILRVIDNMGETLYQNEGKTCIGNSGKQETEILGILGTFTGLLISPLGLILGIISLNKQRKSPNQFKKSAKTWAVTSIIIGSLGLLFILMGLIA